MSEKPKWVGICDVHGLTQESDDFEFILYHAVRCCGKYALMDRHGWEKRLEGERVRAELKERGKGPFTPGADL